MTQPNDRQIFEGEIATYWVDDSGIVVSLSKNPRRTVANITENISLVKRPTNNKRVPLLIYLSNSPMPDKETRKFVAKELPGIYTAMAMVSKPGLARFIINLVFQLKLPPIPMKNFTNDKEEKEWLNNSYRSSHFLLSVPSF